MWVVAIELRMKNCKLNYTIGTPMPVMSPALYFRVDKYMLTWFWSYYGYTSSLLIRWTENQSSIKRYQILIFKKCWYNLLKPAKYRRIYKVYIQTYEITETTRSSNYSSKSMRTKFDCLKIWPFYHQAYPLWFNQQKEQTASHTCHLHLITINVF